jgi:serralysin
MQKVVKHICIDQIVPPHLEDASYMKAVAENHLNESPFEGAGLYTTCWQTGRVLHIRFLEGNSKVHKKVANYAGQWCKYANIDFRFDNSTKAEIRITFKPKEGSWSEVGTNALLRSIDTSTMNFDLSLMKTDEDLSATVLHEFGHVLGMIHEHQSPASGILWNKPAIIQFLAGPPNKWSLGDIETNIFRRYKTSQTQFTLFDPYSIMLYPIPAEWTLNSFEIQMNTTLSQTDKQFIEAWYPPIA